MASKLHKSLKSGIVKGKQSQVSAKFAKICANTYNPFCICSYSYRQMATKQCREFMARMQKSFDENYPEVLRYAMIVNAPKVFSVIFNLLKPVIPKATLEKIDIFGPDPEKWKSIVREKFPTENIPPHWGGSLEGADEFCSGHPIWIQGPADMNAFMKGNKLPICEKY